ncbi:MAG: cation:proton antiporter [Candidatus Binatia bacterium]
MEDELVGLVLILGAGIGAQWLAWRVRLPAILLLLTAGVITGPLTGLIDPDALFGDLLLPGVSLAVAVILFEGGLSLRLRELGDGGAVVWRLCTIGAAVTWALAAAGAYYLLGMPSGLALVFGAILIVTGPTVILPMLRQLRLSQPAASVLKWEGILIDPIGALLAVITFESITLGAAGTNPLVALLASAGIGAILGIAAAALLAWMLGRYYVPDHLRSPLVLAAVAGVFLAANAAAHESGILAATVMGLALAAQRRAPTREILEFKENLRVVLISSLFVVLAAGLDLGELRTLAGPGALFVAWLVVVVRPLGVAVATAGSTMGWRHRLVLMTLAPRGIVAAAVASLFALQLAYHPSIDGSTLIPLTFIVIVGTILVYSVAAPLAARALGVSNLDPQGVLLVGARPWNRELARVLQDCGVKLLLIDDQWSYVREARMAGLTAEHTNVLSEHLADETDLDGIGYMLAVTPNDHTNTLCAVHLSEVFGSANVYQLPTEEGGPTRSERDAPLHLRGRTLFGDDASYRRIASMVGEGAEIRRTSMTDEFDLEAYRQRYGETAVPMLIIDRKGHVSIFTSGDTPRPHDGDTLIGLVNEPRETP